LGRRTALFSSFFYPAKHFHLPSNWLLCSGQRFWETAVATIEERLRLNGSKTRCFLPIKPKAAREENLAIFPKSSPIKDSEMFELLFPSLTI
jgi:hypothetical protein